MRHGNRGVQGVRGTMARPGPWDRHKHAMVWYKTLLLLSNTEPIIGMIEEQFLGAGKRYECKFYLRTDRLVKLYRYNYELEHARSQEGPRYPHRSQVPPHILHYMR